MENFRINHKLDFPVYRQEIKRQYKTLLKIRKIPHRWFPVKNMAYIGYYRIEFVTASEMADFFISIGELTGENV